MTDDLTRYFERRVIQTHEARDFVDQTLLALCSSRPERISTEPTKARMWCCGIALPAAEPYTTGSRSAPVSHAETP